MQYGNLKWSFQSDGIGGGHECSQRLCDARGRRIYVYRWEPNKHTVAYFGADWKKRHYPNYVQYHRGLDVLDVNVRLLQLEVDTRDHQNFHTNEPTLHKVPR